MSGIYIKGMEMPEPGKVIHVFIDSDGRCYRTLYKAAMEVDSFAEAFPVPDHGRLGDLDAIVDREYGNLKYYDPECEAAKRECELIVVLQTAPTIIPADVTDTNVGNICSGRGKPLPYE